MILYNVTLGVDKDIEQEWIQWMKSSYIPFVMQKQIFLDYKFYKVLTHDDDASASYCVQFFTPTIDLFQKYLAEHAHTLIEEHQKRFKDKHVAFQTLLEEI